MPESEPDVYERLLVELNAEFPRFKVIEKADNAFQKFIHNSLRVVTFGKMNDYIEGYFTTLGQRIYVPPRWQTRSAEDRYIVMCHERIHMRQFRKFTWPGMALLYLLVPLPMGLAYFRARFEREAYAETIRASVEIYDLDYVKQDWFRDHILKQFYSASYGWMWPFKKSMNRWYDEQIRLHSAP